MLNDLGEALIKLASGQSFQNIDVVNNERWMVHNANQIFAIACVHSGFSADGAVHHCQQRRRNLDMRNAAVINCRDESRNIADHSAAETDHKRLPVHSRSNHPVANCSDLRERLRFFAGRNRDQHRPKIRRR